jgi:hypothetical protein
VPVSESAASEIRALSGGWGRTLVFVYGVFAVAATGRSMVQLLVDPGRAPLAYSLSLLAAVIYLVATVCLVVGGNWGWRIAGIAVAMAVMNVTTYGFQLVAARILGPAEYGALAGLMALLLVLSVLQLGLQATAARRISSTPGHVAQIERTIMAVTYRAALALGGLTLLASPLVWLALRLDDPVPAVLLAVATVAVARVVMAVTVVAVAAIVAHAVIVVLAAKARAAMTTARTPAFRIS